MNRARDEIEIEKIKVLELIESNPDITVKDILKNVNLSQRTVYNMPEVREIVNPNLNHYYKEIIDSGYSLKLFYSDEYSFSVALIKDEKELKRFSIPQNAKTKEETMDYLRVAKSFTRANQILKEASIYVNELN